MPSLPMSERSYRPYLSLGWTSWTSSAPRPGSSPRDAQGTRARSLPPHVPPLMIFPFRSDYFLLKHLLYLIFYLLLLVLIYLCFLLVLILHFSSFLLILLILILLTHRLLLLLNLFLLLVLHFVLLLILPLPLLLCFPLLLLFFCLLVLLFFLLLCIPLLPLSPPFFSPFSFSCSSLLPSRFSSCSLSFFSSFSSLYPPSSYSILCSPLFSFADLFSCRLKSAGL